MTEGLTRRTVLGGVAAAGAVSLARPAEGLAAALSGSGSGLVSSRWVGSLQAQSPPLDAPRRFALVGVEWAGPAGARIELRTRARGAAWSRWVLASVLGHDADQQEGGSPSPLFGEGIWIRRADWVQVRCSEPVRGLRVHFVSTTADLARSTSAAFPLARPVLDAGPGQPPIIARAAWAQGVAKPKVVPVYGTVKLMFVHHTVNPNGYGAGEVPQLLLAIFDYHRFVRGYNDIAYNFIIDLFGRIWEARAGGIDEAVVGAHAGAYNAESSGVAVLGTFDNVTPSAAAINALQYLVAWKMALHGRPTLGKVLVEVNPSDAFYTPYPPGAHVRLPRVAGHRDGDLTDCPGNAFYAELPSIRPRIGRLAARAATLTLGSGRPVVTVVTPLAVSGRLTALGGGGLAQAPIEIQRVAPFGATTTIATSTTGSDGSWSAGLALRSSALVRALHRPAPAATSDVIEAGVAPLVTLAVDSVSPLTVSGTVSPAKSAVTITLYALAGGRRRKVSTKRVAVKRGQFAARIRARGHGRFVLVAETAADARNAAGAATVAVSL